MVDACDPESFQMVPAWRWPETFSTERQVEFLLEITITREEYERARAQVRRLGLDPDKILHEPLAT